MVVYSKRQCESTAFTIVGAYSLFRMRLAFLTVVKIIVNAAIAMVRRVGAGNSGTVGDGVGAALG